MDKHETRLRKVESRLSGTLTFPDWVAGKSESDQLLILRFYFYLYQLIEAGIDPHGEEFHKELQPNESIAMAVCRLCDLDYRRLISHVEEWRRIS